MMTSEMVQELTC